MSDEQLIRFLLDPTMTEKEARILARASEFATVNEGPPKSMVPTGDSPTSQQQQPARNVRRDSADR